MAAKNWKGEESEQSKERAKGSSAYKTSSVEKAGRQIHERKKKRKQRLDRINQEMGLYFASK